MLEIEIRSYIAEDFVFLTELFYQTVHQINQKDYSLRQLEVWAPKEVETQKWNKRFLSSYTVVALIKEKIVGFGNIDCDGYLDCLYVHANYQRQGVATLIYEALEQKVKRQNHRIETHASITAIPFFQAKGFNVLRPQVVIRQGIELENFIMEKVIKKSET
ncbi:MAG: GNAT family N-acetyltransferase [Turicibacter sanguinis]